MSTSTTIQDFLQIYQTVNGQFSMAVTVMAFFVTALGVITAVVLAFFAIRQINFDREIRKYRDEIKQQRNLVMKESENTIIFLSSTAKDFEEKKKEIEEKLGKLPENATNELKSIEVKIEKLKEEIDFKRGEISASSGVVPTMFTGVPNYFSASLTTCKRCGRNYTKQYDEMNILGRVYNVLETENHLKNECAYCGNIN